ncbi:MAG: glycerol-3-phosphate 1-O-acyltransferase PlsY [Rhodospirillaceae bacterium]|jgi:glycerol-3-phosphate acyltransferase PlsY|nr:glycerol-3-phosphate 1-O-acyltransferase PlsY [Rhodospirillaceae bacterium]
MSELSLLLIGIFGYLLGSIPFGLILTYIAGFGDIRSIGSGNIGATNVLRTGNKILALNTLILDCGKGAVAVWISTWLAGVDIGLLSGLTVVLGHNFPIWLKFRGGKGVATTFGVLLISSWPVGLSTCLAWLITVWIFRISSQAALVALIIAIFTALIWSTHLHVLMVIALAILGFIRHHDNIKRLINGTEPRIY